MAVTISCKRLVQYHFNVLCVWPFTSETQFIVVTHREGTMEECDLLYGATMQQKGVTKLVSVKLKDAIDLAQTA